MEENKNFLLHSLALSIYINCIIALQANEREQRRDEMFNVKVCAFIRN